MFNRHYCLNNVNNVVSAVLKVYFIILHLKIIFKGNQIFTNDLVMSCVVPRPLILSPALPTYVASTKYVFVS